MLRYLLNPKHLTSINRKQTGCEQKSGPHKRYANSSLLPRSGIGWISCCVKPHSLLPARHPITLTSPTAQAPCLCINGQHCIIKMSSWTVCYV